MPFLKLGIHEAMRMTKLNAAAMVETSDLSQLFGDEFIDGNEDVLSKAQAKVVDMLRKSASVLPR